MVLELLAFLQDVIPPFLSILVLLEDKALNLTCIDAESALLRIDGILEGEVELELIGLGARRKLERLLGVFNLYIL